MQITRKCYGCKQDIRKDELIQYTPLKSNTTYWLCNNCYHERIEREKFAYKICEIFGLKSPGPRIWTERRRLLLEGYTDDVILDCLDYVYNIKHMKKLAESLCLVNAENIEEMKRWKADKARQAQKLAEAMTSMQVHEYIVPVKENTTKRQKLNLDDALLE